MLELSTINKDGSDNYRFSKYRQKKSPDQPLPVGKNAISVGKIPTKSVIIRAILI